MPTEKQWASFGRLIRATRESKGLTSPGLAERLAVMVGNDPELTRSAPAIRHWEQGRSKLTDRWVIRGVERALDMKRGELFAVLGWQPPETDMPQLRRPSPSVADSEALHSVRRELDDMRSLVKGLASTVEALRSDLQQQRGARRAGQR